MFHDLSPTSGGGALPAKLAKEARDAGILSDAAPCPIAGGCVLSVARAQPRDWGAKDVRAD